jgi:thymidylate kinase
MTGETLPRAALDKKSGSVGYEPQFIVLEGLDGAGKSTVADAIVALTGGINVTKLAADSMGGPSRETIFHSESPEARYHYWACVNYLVGDLAREVIARGRVAVADSYFFRTIVTHQVFDVKMDMEALLTKATRPDRAVLLTVPDSMRMARLHERKTLCPPRRWHRQLHDRWRQVLALYRAFNLAELDSSESPESVALGVFRNRDATRFKFDANGSDFKRRAVAVGSWPTTRGVVAQPAPRRP